MTDKLSILLSILAGICLASTAAAQTEFMSVDQLQPGMSGVVRTTLHGTKVEELSAEVLGVLRNVMGPESHLILVRVTDERIQNEGVANGMSGSPLYVDGKLVGALSTRIGFFPKEAIAGVTPIGNILSTQFGGRGNPNVSLDYHRLWGSSPAVQQLAGRIGMSIPERTEKAVVPPGDERVIPPLLTLNHSGLDPMVIERFAPVFREMGFELVRNTTVGNSSEQIQGKLESGMPVMVEIISGDMSMGASGTVTYIEGNKVWAFGHPFYQLGEVSFPLARAELIKIFPSAQGSFHITNSGQVIGSIVQDRASAVFGEIGKMADTLPMTVTVKYDGKEIGTYKYNLARVTLMTPALIDICLVNSLLVTQRQYGDMSAMLSGSIAVDNHESIKVDNFYSGLNVLNELSELPSAIYFFLKSNEFHPVRVSSIDLSVDLVEEQRIATLERAWLSSTEIKPGKGFTLKMELKPHRSKAIILEENYFIPPTIQSGKYNITVGSGSAIAQQENELVQGEFKLRDVSQMIRLINSLRPNYKLYAQTYREEEGVYFEGDFFPGLPPSALSVIKSNKGDDNFVRLRGTVMDERQVKTQYLVNGVRKLSFTVKR